ncbi:epidermal cell surface receptor-like protein, partial [Euroglyphus maynei]
NILPETLPKVLVTYRNASSITIVFDDFKTDPESGYAIHYRPNSGFMQQHNQWLIIKSNGTPFYTLTGLKPNSNYMIQVFTWSEFDHKQIVRNFCVSPYLSVNEAQKTNLKCTFATNDDKCCLQCINSDGDHHLPSSFLLERESQSTQFIGKPGICPTNSIIHGGDNQTCTNECTHDYHCTGISKCCKNHCGLLSCQTPVNLHHPHQQHQNSTTVIAVNDDCPLKCDPNAECRYIEEESAYRCICRDDYTGNKDEKMNGCHHYDLGNNVRKHLCHFHNKTYHIGQTFEFDCHICQCSEALEIECKRKCIDYQSDNIPANCHLVEDVYDPICCKKQICHHYHYSNDDNHNENISCHHSNQTYKVNETFNIGCELKCLCQSNGQIECQPRCFDDNGYHEMYCHLRPDPDDPECCKISICDYNSTITEHKLLVEMAESINSTAIKFRLLLFNLNNDENITIHYGQFNQNITTELDNITYFSEIITNQMITIVTNDSKEIVLTNLKPETDYSVYFESGKFRSNTVVVRTFPNGIDHTFKGCFHGSEIIQVGEIFYDGECEFKCICKEGGIRDCIERCPVFVDLIGLENCQMVPSPDDSCCTIPICDNEKSVSVSDCLFENGKHYRIGDRWNHGEGCMEKTCTCVLNKYNYTEVKCKNHCPEILPSVLKPSDDCPSPQLIQTNDPCAC